MKPEKQEVIDYLRKIQKGFVPKIESMGICGNLEDETWFYLKGSTDINDIYRQFKYYSGCLYYPIACPFDSKYYSREYSEQEIYYGTKNLYVGEYGRRRRLLAKDLADNFEYYGLPTK